MAMATPDDWQSGKSLVESTSFMFDNELGTDVTFKFSNGKETVKAHRVILMARSHVFFTMFNSGLDKLGQNIDIADIQPAIFKQFLRYLYLDETRLTTTEAVQLTYCAEKYQVTALKALCMGFLQQQVNETTCAQFLDHAVFYNHEPLTHACLHFLKSCKSLGIKGLQEYHISRETLEVILDYEELPVREVDIYKFCKAWAEQECKKKEVPVNMTNKRKMLGPVAKKIPFCSMRQEEFVAEVSGKHFLNGQEELQIFRYLCAADKANPPFPYMEPREAAVKANPPFPYMEPGEAADKTEPPFPYMEPGEAADKTKAPFLCMKLTEAADKANKPFPCMKLTEAKDVQVSVKLPDVWDSGYNKWFSFSISCSQSFTLVGLTFTHPGTFYIWFHNVCEHLQVPPGDLTVYLKKVVKCEAGTKLEIWQEDVPDPDYLTMIEFPFSGKVKAHDAGLYDKLDFVITKHDDYFHNPPFDTLIVML